MTVASRIKLCHVATKCIYAMYVRVSKFECYIRVERQSCWWRQHVSPPLLQCPYILTSNKYTNIFRIIFIFFISKNIYNDTHIALSCYWYWWWFYSVSAVSVTLMQRHSSLLSSSVSSSSVSTCHMIVGKWKISYHLSFLHGRMGRRFPDGGLLRYKKWVPQQLGDVIKQGSGDSRPIGARHGDTAANHNSTHFLGWSTGPLLIILVDRMGSYF